MTQTSWLADYQRRAEDLGARARRAREAMEGATGTGSSASGAVTVTVGPAGALRGISFTERADELSRPRLAEAIMDAARRAHAEAGRRCVDALQPLVGDSEAARVVRGFLPGPTAGDGEEGGTTPAPPAAAGAPRRAGR